MHSVTPDAEEALSLYERCFGDGFVLGAVDRYGPGEGGTEGMIRLATFELGGVQFRCMDGTERHEWGFTPAVSMSIECDNDDEIQRLCEQLSDGGEVMMPLADWGFSTSFTWFNDRHGVSWQLNLT